MLVRIATHRSVQSSAAAGLVLASVQTFRDLPPAIWFTWATLSAIAVVQAVRDE